MEKINVVRFPQDGVIILHPPFRRQIAKLKIKARRNEITVRTKSHIPRRPKGGAARFACRAAIRLPDEQREEPCAARSQEVERALCGVRMCRGKVKRADGTSASADATKKNAPM